MKIDDNTLNILKNFSRINSSIIINPGNELKTMAPTKNIIAYSNLSIVFDKKVLIYNLDRFISTLNMFDDPELNLQDNLVVISDGNKFVNYVYAEEDSIKNCKPPEKKLKLPTVDVSFTLKNEDLKNVEKASSVLNLPEIIFNGDGKDVYIQTSDIKNPTGDVYSIKLSETDKQFKVVFKKDNVKIIPDDYEISISKKKIAQFKGNNVEYFIAIESTSIF